MILINIKELWENFIEKSKELEREIFTFMSPEPHTYNFDKTKIQIREIRKVKKSLNKLKNNINAKRKQIKRSKNKDIKKVIFH